MTNNNAPVRKQAEWGLVILIVHNKHRLNAKDDLRLNLGIWIIEVEWEEEEIPLEVAGAEEAADIHHSKFNEKDDFRAIQHNRNSQ